MATQNEIVYNIAELTGREADFTTIERLKLQLLTHRELLVRRMMEINATIPKIFLQEICVPMELDLDPPNFGIKLSKSAVPIPTLISLKSRSSAAFIGSIDGISSYAKLQSLAAVKNLAYKKFTFKFPYYCIDNNYLYTINVHPESVYMYAVFSNPSELSSYVKRDGTISWKDEDEFPISGDVLQQVTQAIVSSELQTRQIKDPEIHASIDRQ